MASKLLIIVALFAGLACAMGAFNEPAMGETYSLALRIESIDNLEPGSKLQRQKDLARFAEIIKSKVANKHYWDMTRLAKELSRDAQVTLSHNEGNIFSNMMKGMTLWGMSNKGNFDPELEKFVDFVKRATDSDQNAIACALTNFKIKHLSIILFLLKTDIKTLLTEDKAVINNAIFKQLQAAKFVSDNDYFADRELSKDQKSVLLKYFASNVNTKLAKVKDAVDHAITPGQFVVGRLIDTCQSVLTFKHPLLEADKDIKGCTSDVDFFKHLVLNRDTINEVFTFCHQFIHTAE